MLRPLPSSTSILKANPQIGVDLLVNPPSPSSPSYPLYLSETSTTHAHLKSRSSLMADRFNALEGMSCQPAEGAMYLFPQIVMPKKAEEEAERRGKKADVMYALDLLGMFWIGRLVRSFAGTRCERRREEGERGRVEEGDGKRRWRGRGKGRVKRGIRRSTGQCSRREREIGG